MTGDVQRLVTSGMGGETVSTATMSTQATFDEENTCIESRTRGSSSNSPAGLSTILVASMYFGAGEPHHSANDRVSTRIQG
jgi:hypothetical protein